MAAKPPKSKPTSETLKKCCEVAFATLEGAAYLGTQAKKLFEDLKISAEDSFKRFLNVVHNQHQNLETRDQRNSDQIWRGMPPLPYVNPSEQSVLEATSTVGSNKLPSLHVDYAIDVDSHFVRGYSSEGKPLTDENLARVDKEFHKWLDTKNMVCGDGGLIKYQTTGPDGAEMKVSKETFDGMMKEFDKHLEGIAEKVEIVNKSPSAPAISQTSSTSSGKGS
jgi:hypothetical protein